MKIYNLNSTTQKSYYGKAKVIESENKSELQSYDTIVCKIEKGKFVKLWNGYSVTTLNHVNDFRRLFGLSAINKKEWLSIPCDNNERYKIVLSNSFTTFKPSVLFDNEYDAADYADEINARSGWRSMVDIVPA